ncbi:MAG: dipeptide epimerase [Bradyrhizobiaceae bacterium]|nr:dipeptide epimerase [Hyphomicrobiales bacterium]MBV9428742.1 dipeptide epimerase [Bradyrhizobiaceae bacterium]
MPLSLTVCTERWPVAGSFTIARGSRTEVDVVVAEISDGTHVGRGECVPYRRYGETIAKVLAAIEAQRDALAHGLDLRALQTAMTAGAARNALDCALWDLEAKRAGRPVHVLADLPPPQPVTTALTISLGTPEVMGAAAAKAAGRALLKVKLGGDGDPERIAAVRRAAPKSELIVDANESWSAHNLANNLAACSAAGVTLVEQPLPQSADDALANFSHPIAVCADESAHDRTSLERLAGKYDAINIKLDKAGGLTEALQLADEGVRRGFMLMVGCMVATSLSMAPAVLVAQRARVVDLDGPLILARDRPHGLVYEESRVHPATPELWG